MHNDYIIGIKTHEDRSQLPQIILIFNIFPRNVSSAFLLAGHGSSRIVKFWDTLRNVGSVFVHKTGAVANFEPPTYLLLLNGQKSSPLFVWCWSSLV